MCLNQPKYIKKGEVTDYALHNAHECFLPLTVTFPDKLSKNGKKIIKYLKSTSNSNSANKDVSNDSFALIIQSILGGEEDFKKSHKHIAAFLDIKDLLKYYYDKYDVLSYSWWEIKCGVSARSLKKYIDGESKPEAMSLIKIGIGFKLSPQEIIHMLHITNNISTNLTDTETLLNIFLISAFSKKTNGLVQAYKELKKNNKEEILGLTSDFKEHHSLE